MAFSSSDHLASGHHVHVEVGSPWLGLFRPGEPICYAYQIDEPISRLSKSTHH